MSGMRDRLPLHLMTGLDELFAAFTVADSVRIAAPPERVWAVVADVERIVEFSPECVKVEWLDGATAPAVGARYAGTSRVGSFEWTRNCTITELREPELFAYEVFDELDERAQSRWRFEIAADGDGSVVMQRFSHVPDGRSTVRLMAEADPAKAEATIAERAQMLRAGMRRTLGAMRDALERTEGT
jgi:uncharacterized protein YndB with AHSA1/START domain